ncbi:hypothetical protein [Synechococcus phage Ssp-JY38]|nr:hypothetical protein [Synechococcus phage Yong-L2-223]
MFKRLVAGIVATGAIIGYFENPAHSQESTSERGARGIARVLIATEMCEGLSFVNEEKEREFLALGDIFIAAVGERAFERELAIALIELTAKEFTCESVAETVSTHVTLE